MLGKGWFPEQLGGLDRYYRELLEHLPEASGVVIGSTAGAPGRVLGVSAHERPLLRRLAAYWRAAQRAADRTDVVDSHFALYAVAPLLIGRLRGRPAILHFHGPWADENVSAGDLSGIRQTARRRLERVAYGRTAHAIVLSSAFRQVLVERYGVRPWNVSVEPPGVDLDRFTPGPVEPARSSFGLSREGFVAVAARRLVPRMGLDVLVDAWSEAVSDLPPGSALLIAGEGPHRETLADTIAKRGVADSVSLLGRISDERLVELYRAADVAVFPTIAHEGFGMAVLEAAASGTPSIVTAVGGLPEAIAGLDGSLIVAPGNPAALRDRLLRAKVDRPSRAATRAYAERFQWSAVADRHRAIVRRAVVGPGADDRLKVVYLDHVARLSGGEIALLRLLPHLDRVCPHVILAEDGPLVGQLHLAGISTEVLRLGEPGRGLRKSEVHARGVSPRAAVITAGYVLRLAARLRRLRPDLVHTNSLKAGVYGSLAARLAGVRVVWHVRDRIADDYLPSQAVSLVRRMSHHLADAVVANSRSTLETLQAPSPSSMVVYSVLPEVMTDVPLRQRKTRSALTFGVVGRLAPWKGQDLFLRAFASAFPGGGERAVIVGGALFGEDDYAASLERLLDELGLKDRVELRGHRTDVWEELSRMDVLVHSSITPEPFGQVVLEGMAAGVPVIAARAGGPAEILEHDVTGLLYEPANVDRLAEAMQRTRDPALRERLSAAAREGLGRYSPPVVAAELQQLYAMLAVRAGRRR
jgi:glycosyltransferase involved in cell wall biosynthesis